MSKFNQIRKELLREQSSSRIRVYLIRQVLMSGKRRFQILVRDTATNQTKQAGYERSQKAAISTYRSIVRGINIAEGVLKTTI